MGLLRDRTSHVYAATRGWLFAPSEATQIAYWQRDLHVLDHTSAKKRGQWKPLVRPWEPHRAPVMGDDRRARLKAHAKRMTGR